MAGKCSWIGLKVGVRSYYSGSIAGLFVGRFRSPKKVVGPPSLLLAQGFLHSPLPTTKPNLTSLVSPRPSSRARPIVVPNPTRTVGSVGSGSSPNIYKTSSFLFLDSLPILFSSVRFRSDDPNPSLLILLLYIPDETLETKAFVPLSRRHTPNPPR